MALKSNTPASVLKPVLKAAPTGNSNPNSLTKATYTPKKVASGNVSSGEMELKTEPSTGGLKG